MADDNTEVLAALTRCITQEQAQAALAQADAWLKDHPDDEAVIGACESAAMVSEMWDLDLDQFPQAERDMLMERARRMDNGDRTGQ